MVQAVHAAPPWPDRASAALADPRTPCREHLAAMLQASSASPESIAAALDLLPELYPPARAFLGGSLGRMLIRHPARIGGVLGEETDPARQRALCQAVVRALRVRPDRGHAVFRVLSPAHAALMRRGGE